MRAQDRHELLAVDPAAQQDTTSQPAEFVTVPIVSMGEAVTAAFLYSAQHENTVPDEPGVKSQISSESLTTLPTVESDTPDELNSEFVSVLREETEKRTDLDEVLKSQILAHLDRSANYLQQGLEAEQRYAKQKAERDNAPTLIGELKAELEKPPLSSEPEYPVGASVAELDRLRLAEQERLEDARKSLEAWESRAKTRAERRPQLPSLVESTKTQLDEARKNLNVPILEGEHPLLTNARRTEQQAHCLLLAAQLELYLIEQLRYESLHEMFPLQRDLLTRNRNALERRSERWKELLAQARLQESERQRIDARQRLEMAHPALRDMAQRNSWLTQYRQEHLQVKNAWKAEQSDVNERLSAIRQKFNEVQDRVQRVGLTTAIGLTLRNHKASLPDARSYRYKQREAEEDFVRLQTEQLQLDDERKSLDDIDGRIHHVVAMVELSDVSDEELHKMVRELLLLQREYLDAILSDLESSLMMLVEIDFTCRQLSQVIREYNSYIDQRVLWIRSVPQAGWSTPHLILREIHSLVGNGQWEHLSDFMSADMRKQWSLYAIVSLAVVVFWYAGRRFSIAIAHTDTRSINQLDAGVNRMLMALLVMVVLAAAGPMLIGFVGWRFSRSGSSVGVALGGGLQYAAIFLWVLRAFYWIVRQEGMAQNLWLWSESVVKNLRQNLQIYAWGAVPLCTISVAAHRFEDGTSAETVGRAAFVLFCLLVASVLAGVFNPRGTIVACWLRSTLNSMVYKTRWIWYPTLVLTPVSLAVLAMLGYLYTAEQLMLRLELTLGLMAVLVIAATIVNRWIMAARRRLALKQARLKREAERTAMVDGSSFSSPISVESEQLDLSAVNLQVMRLVKVTAVGLMLSGCWFIWDQVFPALQIFTRVEVWSTITTVAEVVQTATGPEVQEISRLDSITREHVLMAIGVLIICILASRNLPGLLELSVLQRLPLDSGSHNAVKLLTGYAFLAVGIAISTNMIGLRWSSVQWLVAALTVGLGFGLQEIFANFVSGLIILFERPVRIGDVVTIDGVSGSVTRIRSRATTITDWDRKEFIVPNKEFVTGRLLNWTLTDRTTRVLINVGVAYGSDVRLALELMKRAAEDNPIVLQEPAPMVTFESFGDSTLNLVLRGYLPSLENRLQVLTELNTAINDSFQQAGIEIAFPQHDLHIRSVSPQAAAAAAAMYPGSHTSSSVPMEIGAENLARQNGTASEKEAA